MKLLYVISTNLHHVNPSVCFLQSTKSAQNISHNNQIIKNLKFAEKFQTLHDSDEVRLLSANSINSSQTIPKAARIIPVLLTRHHFQLIKRKEKESIILLR